MKVFANISRGFIPKRRIASKYRIIGICQRAINIITCAKEGASLINKQGLVKKMRICFNIKATLTNGFRVA